jgi:ankyrin repeat-rich membrane spanning protein
MSRLSSNDLRLWNAIERGDAVAVQQALGNGVNVNFVHEHEDSTPLLEACRRGYDEIVRILLDAGADARWKNKVGWSAFYEACRGERLSTVQLLLNHDKDLMELADNDGITPLIVAAHHSDIVRFLLDRGANVYVTARNGITTLMKACQSFAADPEIVRMLIAAGVNVEARNLFQRTALHLAAEYGRIEAMRELILQHNANLFAVDRNGETPFDLACRMMGWPNNTVDQFLDI